MSDIKKEEVKTPEELFVEEYTALCKKYHRQISVVPAFIARDDNTWSVQLKSGISILTIPKTDASIDSQG